MSAISPSRHEAILPVNLTYSYKVVELPINMTNPTAVSTAKIETARSSENRPPVVSIGRSGSITDFREPSTPAGTNQKMNNEPRAILAKWRERTPQKVAEIKAFEAIGRPLESAKAA